MYRFFVVLAATAFFIAGSLAPAYAEKQGQAAPPIAGDSSIAESASMAEAGSSFSFVHRAVQAGPVVFLILLFLMGLSVLTWAVLLAKWVYLRQAERRSVAFVHTFWESRSLNELNSRLGDHPYSPVREVFRNGYAELVRGSQLREQTTSLDIAVGAAMDNLNRTLQKAKWQEKSQLERLLPVLAISASASPFIGLFGTVWGIMNAFEGIARSGSASLATVAPGISEALIATAFGLAAAIPAVIGYNLANSRIRSLLTHLDGFCADFLNIVERYLVSERSTKTQASPEAATPRI